nr:NADH dehydrogenase subunit 1 [Metanigrus sp.]
MSCFFLYLFIFIGVAFFTLLERKILSFIQFRSGPFKVGLVGIFQPFSDALSLFSKEFNFMFFGNFFFYYCMPFFSLLISMVFWLLYPFFFNLISFDLGGLFLICLLGLGVYFIMISGWSSFSLYSLLGGMRSISQSISYEVSYFFIFIFFFLLMGGFNLILFYYFQIYIWFLFFFFPLFFIYFSCVLAESNRSPYDFSEGESELVSGFNLEYSSLWFSFFFLSEYMMMMFMSFLSCMFFFCSDLFTFFFFFSVLFFVFLFIWIRSTFPRFRYDKLMYLSWSIYLPCLLNLFFCLIYFKMNICFIQSCM